jgi:hypothetical protein
VTAVTEDAQVHLSGAKWNADGDENSMYNITDSAGAQAAWAGGITGKGVGVALIDSGISPVNGLAGPARVVNGPDLSFVQRVSVDARDRAVVRSAVQSGHALGLEVVAEGVEDAATLAHLTREGCNVVQGYYISRPLPADEFELWLASRPRLDANVVYPRFGAWLRTATRCARSTAGRTW